jgi:Flp pilus assembly protein TadD
MTKLGLSRELFMPSQRIFTAIWLIASLSAIVTPLSATSYEVIVRGKVTMQDGSPPPAGVEIQRECSDGNGSTPGPRADKKGEYIWRLANDTTYTRTCRIEASLSGYSSTSVDISGLMGFVSKTVDLPPIVLSIRGDPRVINSTDTDVPGAARAAWKLAMKAVESSNSAEVAKQLRLVVAAAPKFARGWHTLGITYENDEMVAEAKDAYMRATGADPRMLVSWVTLSRVDVLAKDWQGAVSAADTAIKLDQKHMYPEVYLHQAVARFEMNDLPGAESSANEALRLDPKERKFRGEFVLGRILAAKGDAAGARTHVAKYLALNPSPPDIELIKGYLDVIGKPEADALKPDLELP